MTIVMATRRLLFCVATMEVALVSLHSTAWEGTMMDYQDDSSMEWQISIFIQCLMLPELLHNTSAFIRTSRHAVDIDSTVACMVWYVCTLYRCVGSMKCWLARSCFQVTPGFELYAVFGPLVTKPVAISSVNKLLRWIKVSNTWTVSVAT